VSISCRCSFSDGRFFFSIGYVEFRTIDLVEKAIALKGTVVMGLPIMVQLTESERNKLHPGDG
jgi:RNA-binding protein 39